MIDVWDASTFWNGMTARLRAHECLIVSFFVEEHRLRVERDRADHRGMPLSNEYYGKFHDLLDSLGREITLCTVRGWHNTRLTDVEIIDMRRNGIVLSTPTLLERRLNSLVAAGLLSEPEAHNLACGSPFRTDQRAARQGRFWASVLNQKFV